MILHCLNDSLLQYLNDARRYPEHQKTIDNALEAFVPNTPGNAKRLLRKLLNK